MIAEATASVLAQYGRTPADEGARRDNDGLYHMASGGSTSWFGFAERIIGSQTSSSESRPRLTPIRSNEYPSAAARPRYSVLQSDRLHSAFGVRLPDWTDGFNLFFKQSQEQAYS
jgi:dTDP-4-dehydrorhamnose reductase